MSEHECCDEAREHLLYAYGKWVMVVEDASVAVTHCPWCGAKLDAQPAPATGEALPEGWRETGSRDYTHESGAEVSERIYDGETHYWWRRKLDRYGTPADSREEAMRRAVGR